MSEPREAGPEKGIEWLSQLLTLQEVSASVDGHLEGEPDDADSSYWLTIDDSTLSPEQVETLIGEKGAVLDAIQYLANTTLNLGRQSEQQAYTIELAGYRARRLEELQQTADQAAAEARTGQEAEIKGLSSAERRQVHNLLKDHDGLETFSRGREPDRRLVVRLLQPPEDPEADPEAAPEVT